MSGEFSGLARTAVPQIARRVPHQSSPDDSVPMILLPSGTWPSAAGVEPHPSDNRDRHVTSPVPGGFYNIMATNSWETRGRGGANIGRPDPVGSALIGRHPPLRADSHNVGRTAARGGKICWVKDARRGRRVFIFYPPSFTSGLSLSLPPPQRRSRTAPLKAPELNRRFRRERR